MNPMHPLRTLETLEVWLVGHIPTTPSPTVDAILGSLALAVIVLFLMSTTRLPGEHAPRRGHRPTFRPGTPVTAKMLAPLASDDVMAFPALDRLTEAPAVVVDPVHVGATEDWRPSEEVAAVDNFESEWQKIIAMATAELRELSADLEWPELGSTPELDAALATAERWHAEHGRHCACCHEGVIWAEWRTGENTIEIRRDQLVAAGVQ